jgi:hypothetical protein
MKGIYKMIIKSKIKGANRVEIYVQVKTTRKNKYAFVWIYVGEKIVAVRKCSKIDTLGCVYNLCYGHVFDKDKTISIRTRNCKITHKQITFQEVS